MNADPEQASAMRIEQRDLLILRELFVSRTMTSRHLASMFFNGSKDAANKRIKKLKSIGLIAERQRRPTDPSILTLGKRAPAVLGERGILSEYPQLSVSSMFGRSRVSDLTLRH